MIKKDELEDPDSCLNKADDDEMLFILLARDQCSANIIRNWASLRVMLGLNKHMDDKIIEALECANEMEKQYAARNGKLN